MHTDSMDTHMENIVQIFHKTPTSHNTQAYMHVLFKFDHHMKNLCKIISSKFSLWLQHHIVLLFCFTLFSSLLFCSIFFHLRFLTTVAIRSFLLHFFVLVYLSSAECVRVPEEDISKSLVYSATFVIQWRVQFLSSFQLQQYILRNFLPNAGDAQMMLWTITNLIYFFIYHIPITVCLFFMLVATIQNFNGHHCNAM